MKSVLVIFLSSILLFGACSGSSDMKMSKDKLKNVLLDLYMADAIVGVENITSPIKLSLDTIQYENILKSHNITLNQLSWNIVYYSNLKQMSEIYADVVNELTLKEAATRGNSITDSIPSDRLNK